MRYVRAYEELVNQKPRRKKKERRTASTWLQTVKPDKREVCAEHGEAGRGDMKLFGGSSSSKHHSDSRQRRTRSKRPENPFRESPSNKLGGNKENALLNGAQPHRGSRRRQKSQADAQARTKPTFSLFTSRFGSSQDDVAGNVSGGPSKDLNVHSVNPDQVGLVPSSIPDDMQKMPADHDMHVKTKRSQSWMLNVFSSGKRAKAAHSNRERASDALPHSPSHKPRKPDNLNILSVDPGSFDSRASFNGPSLPFPAKMGGWVDKMSANGCYMPDGSFVPFGVEPQSPKKMMTSTTPAAVEAPALRQSNSTRAELQDSISYGESSADSNYVPSPDSQNSYSTQESPDKRRGHDAPDSNAQPQEALGSASITKRCESLACVVCGLIMQNRRTANKHQ